MFIETKASFLLNSKGKGLYMECFIITLLNHGCIREQFTYCFSICENDKTLIEKAEVIVGKHTKLSEWMHRDPPIIGHCKY